MLNIYETRKLKWQISVTESVGVEQINDNVMEKQRTGVLYNRSVNESRGQNLERTWDDVEWFKY